jgi:RNA polymerase-binding transcription factor DksA
MLNLAKYQAQLENNLVIIKAELSAIANYDEENDNWEAVPEITELQEADINSEADAVEAWNERRATVSALETEYRDIKRALAKIPLGTFGLCEIAGEPIEEKRLDAKVTARTCIAHREEETELSL